MRGVVETRDTDTYLNCVPLCVQIQDLEGDRDSTADAEDKEVNYIIIEISIVVLFLFILN